MVPRALADRGSKYSHDSILFSALEVASGAVSRDFDMCDRGHCSLWGSEIASTTLVRVRSLLAGK
jgi:hypothetical protein